MLDRWKGASGRLAVLTESHSTLVIVLYRKGKTGNLVVSCLGPSHICTPTFWENSNIALSVDTDKKYAGMSIFDDSLGITILADSVEVKENVGRYNSCS